MTDTRLPAHVEVAGLIRAVEAAGGFATVLHKGERDAGAIAIVTVRRGEGAQLWERMPELDGTRRFRVTREQDGAEPQAFWDYLDRRAGQDRDLWVVELDVRNPERFIAG